MPTRINLGRHSVHDSRERAAVTVVRCDGFVSGYRAIHEYLVQNKYNFLLNMPNRNYRLYCAVFGCLNSSLTHPDITFFKLPGNSERRFEWLQQMCRSDLENKSNFAAYRVCEKHFNVEDVRQSVNRKLLKKNALPLLMLPSVLSAVPGGSRKEDKQTQTALSIGIEKCTQTENAMSDNYAQTLASPSCNTPRKRKLKKRLNSNAERKKN